MNCSPPGSSIHGIFQARVLVWGVQSWSTYKKKYLELLFRKSLLPHCLPLCACSVTSVKSSSLWRYGLQPTRLLCPRGSPGKNAGVGCYALLQRIFLSQGSNRYLLCPLHWHVGSLSLVPAGKIPSHYEIVCLFHCHLDFRIDHMINIDLWVVRRSDASKDLKCACLKSACSLAPLSIQWEDCALIFPLLQGNEKHVKEHHPSNLSSWVWNQTQPGPA